MKVRLFDDKGNPETLWAAPLGGDRYRLDNMPWFVYGVSSGDIVEARPRRRGDLPEFVRLVEKSGNRTLRVILDPPPTKSRVSKGVLEKMRKLGCSYEGANERLFAVTVPADVDLERVRQVLLETGYRWEHADPTYEELFPNG